MVLIIHEQLREVSLSSMFFAAWLLLFQLPLHCFRQVHALSTHFSSIGIFSPCPSILSWIFSFSDVSLLALHFDMTSLCITSNSVSHLIWYISDHIRYHLSETVSFWYYHCFLLLKYSKDKSTFFWVKIPVWAIFKLTVTIFKDDVRL